MEKEERESLELSMHPDEDFWTMQIGHLNDHYCNTRCCLVRIPSQISYDVRANNIRILFMFRELRELKLQFNSDNTEIEQKLFAALGELIMLTSLELVSGKLAHDIDLGPLSSLNRLQQLKVTPFREYGLVDDDVKELACLTNLTGLSILASSVGFTQEGLKALVQLSMLRSLSICPIGNAMGTRSLEALRELPYLSCLTLGIENSNQTIALSQLTWIDQLRLKVTDANADMASVLSVCNWCLVDNLYSLQVGTLEVGAVEFLLSVATLTRLTELKVSTRERPSPHPHPSPTADLSALTPLTNLQSFEFLCCQHAPVHLSVQGISLLALQWPYLRTLSLSLVGKSGLMQEAVDLLDNFVHLESLSLFAASDLDPSCEGPLASVNLHYLPQHLTSLVFELVELTWLHMLSSVRPRSLPELSSLELDCCVVEDDLLQAWTPNLHGLRHLELISPSGVTDTGLAILPKLQHLTHLVVVAPDNPDITQAALLHAGALAKLRHLEWASPDMYHQVNVESVLPVLYSMTNLHFLALRTNDPHMTNPHGWKAALTSRLPYCTVSMHHGLQLYSQWEGYRVTVAAES